MPSYDDRTTPPHPTLAIQWAEFLFKILNTHDKFQYKFRDNPKKVKCILLSIDILHFPYFFWELDPV